MGYWVGVLTAQEYEAERQRRPEGVRLRHVLSGAPVPVAGDEVVLVTAGDEARVVGLGRVRGTEPVDVTYSHRLFEAPLPVDGPLTELRAPGCHPIEKAAFAAVAARIGPEFRVDGRRRDWLVSVALPIEAGTPAEAVQSFWTYVGQLGPTQLPAFVSPSGDELAMQAYLLGEPTNLDPEEDE